jgi:hypothetical protein
MRGVRENSAMGWESVQSSQMKNRFQTSLRGFLVEIPMFVGVVIIGLTGLQLSVEAEELFSTLSKQGISADRILEVDHRGIPVLCGTEGEADFKVTQQAKPQPPPPSSVLLPGMRSWECVPSVIRADGIDSFRVEVDVNGFVSNVVLTLAVGTEYLTFANGPLTQNLRDDGLNGDRVAGDHIYTSERMIFTNRFSLPSNLYYDAHSPEGLHCINLGFFYIVETNGVTNQFLIDPIVGLLDTKVPLVERVQLRTNVMASSHLVNVMTGTRQSQKGLRLGSFSGMNVATAPIYSALPDAFDFVIFLSVDHVEYLPYTYSMNFVSGAHSRVRVNYTGTGLATGDSTAYFGSGGRLLGINVLDVFGRGIYASVCTHELLHQWASFTSGSLGLTSSDGSHYSSVCSVTSLVGGGSWNWNTNGTYTRECGVHSIEAPPLDRYMMGLIWASNVPPLFVDTNGARCYSTGTNYRTVTISEIQAVHGVRTPTPATSQKNFSLCFAAESFQRFLSSAEMTFYDVLAEFYTRQRPEGESYPGVAGWRSIDGYFGEGSKWSSDALDVIRPKIVSIERSTNGTARVLGTGYPGKIYTLLRSTDLQAWASVTNRTADTNGAFTLVDGGTSLDSFRFYRVATP